MLRPPVVLALLMLTDCAAAPAAPSSPCRGAALDMDALTERCTVQGVSQPDPPAAALKAELVPAQLSARSGAQAPLRVRLTNVTAAPLALDITLGCMAFEAAAYRPDGTRADWESDELLGALCGHGAPVRLTVEPGGTVEKAVTYAARRRKLVCRSEGQACDEQPAGDLPPGEYRLEVTLPFTDPDPQGGVRSRTVEGRLVVSP